jgi:hypothetical protein
MIILDTIACTVDDQTGKDHPWSKEWHIPGAIPGGTGGGRIGGLFHQVEEGYVEALSPD